jgi:uncharacterized protein involved in type VI secretion and phage assembly
MNFISGGSGSPTEDAKIYGVVIGVVTDNEDKEGMGRVKVKFPWRDDNDDSYWARIASLMAGANRGTYFLPEVGDEVLVAFDHGDIHFPYVLGALWNGKDTPPETNNDGKNNIRKITSRSGHKIIFNDDSESGKEKLEIHTKAGHKIVLDDSSGQEKIDIVDKSGKNSVNIDSVQNAIAIKSEMKLSIESKMIDIKSGGMMNIEATGNLIIKGAMVMIN